MAGEITQSKIIIAEPTPGQRVKISGGFTYSKEILDLLGPGGVQDVMINILLKLRDIASRSIVEQYKATGLRIITGKLLAEATQNYTLDVGVNGRKIIIRMQWKAKPSIPYFFAQLFGWKFIPAHSFINFSKRMQAGFSSIIQNGLKKEIKNKLAAAQKSGRTAKPKKARRGRQVIAGVEIKRGKPKTTSRKTTTPQKSLRPTGRKLRQRLVRVGQYTRAEARAFQETLSDADLRAALSLNEAQLRFLRKVQANPSVAIRRAIRLSSVPFKISGFNRDN